MSMDAAALLGKAAGYCIVSPLASHPAAAMVRAIINAGTPAMRFFALACLAACLWLGAVSGAQAQRRVEVADTGISLEVPQTPAFSPAAGFDGLVAQDIGATVHVAVLKEGFGDSKRAIERATADNTSPLRLISRRSIGFGRWDGRFVQARQVEGDLTYVKYIAAFGDRSFTALVVTTFPAINERAYADVFRRMTRSARGLENYLSSDPQSVDYRIDAADPLIGRKADGARRVFALPEPVEGQVPTDPGEPRFFVEATPYPGQGPDNRRAYAQLLFERDDKTVEQELQLIEDHEIDGMPAVLIVGKARHADEPQRIRRLYQAILFAGEGYYLMRGAVDLPFSSEWLPKFVKMSDSFERIRPREGAG